MSGHMFVFSFPRRAWRGRARDRLRLAVAVLRGRCVHMEMCVGGDSPQERTFLAIETTRPDRSA